MSESNDPPKSSEPSGLRVEDSAPPAPPPSSATDAVIALPEWEARRIDLYWALATVLALGLVFLLLSLFRGVGVPVLLALALAYALNPLVTRISRRMKRVAATAVALGVLLVAFVGFLVYLVPTLRDEFAKLPAFFKSAGTQLFPWIEGRFGVSMPELVRQRAVELGDEAAGVLQSAGPALARLAAAAAGNTARFLATIVGLLVVPVLAFFFLKDYPRLLDAARSLIPRRAGQLVARRFGEVDDVLSAFVRGQLTVGAILSILYGIGLSIARIDMAIVIGLLAGFGNMVPYLGTGIGILLAALALVLSWQGPWQLAVIVATFVIAQLAEGLVITPRIVGEKVGLPPVAVIIAVLAFGELFGFVGILLAVPTSAILKVVVSVLIDRYRRTPLYTGEVVPR